MHEKYGIDEEEFNTATVHYNLLKDPEVATVIRQNMKKLGLGGGMSMGGFMS